MGVITLPENMVTDQQNGIKASSQHVQDNFDTLLNAVNNKLEKDGSIVPTADLSMGSHKITNLASPTADGDATNQGWVNTKLLTKANLASPTFTGNPEAPTQAISDNGTKLATTGFIYNVLQALYPVGSLYIGTQNTCPMAQFFGTWQIVATDRALWGGNGTNANTTIDAGLPNITGGYGIICNGSNDSATRWYAYGAMYQETTATRSVGSSSSSATGHGLALDASRSSSIYGNSNTVQPPAYRVNVWRRTA